MGIRFTSVSTMFGGVGWEFTQPQKAIARTILTFLGGRRILRPGKRRPEQDIDYCLASAWRCREALDEYLATLSMNNNLHLWVTAMRDEFIDFIHKGGPRGDAFHADGRVFRAALSELHREVLAGADLIAAKYKLPGLTTPV